MEYTTSFEDLSSRQLNALFSSTSWQELSFQQKLNAAQELENRYAEEHNTWPVQVTIQSMDPEDFGYYHQGKIYLNEALFDTQNDPGHLMSQAGSNWQLYDTLIHEGCHGIQQAQGRSDSFYFSAEADYDLYRIQPNEKEAFLEGNLRTLQAIQALDTPDPHAAAAYAQSVLDNSYSVAYQNASARYDDPAIEETLRDYIEDMNSGYSRENVTDSYRAIDESYNQWLDEQILSASEDLFYSDEMSECQSADLGLASGIYDGLDDQGAISSAFDIQDCSMETGMEMDTDD